jgi:pimeloyl-ACP methyl ester carboxylesterase
VVLVHGAWHGAWCWEEVTPLLDAAGVGWRALDLPLESLAGDAAAVVALLDSLNTRAVLVGHSYGGAVVTVAGMHPAVSHICFLAALPVDDGESCIACFPESEAPGTDLGGTMAIADGLVTLDPKAKAMLYNRCTDAQADAAFARLRPIAMSCLGDQPSVVAWHDRPSTYVVCADDQGIHPVLQRALAQRCGGDVIEWDLDHSPFYSDPARTAALLIDLARAEA